MQLISAFATHSESFYVRQLLIGACTHRMGTLQTVALPYPQNQDASHMLKHDMLFDGPCERYCMHSAGSKLDSHTS